MMFLKIQQILYTFINIFDGRKIDVKRALCCYVDGLWVLYHPITTVLESHPLQMHK